jgi:hypothetical protein
MGGQHTEEENKRGYKWERQKNRGSVAVLRDRAVAFVGNRNRISGLLFCRTRLKDIGERLVGLRADRVFDRTAKALRTTKKRKKDQQTNVAYASDSAHFRPLSLCSICWARTYLNLLRLGKVVAQKVASAVDLVGIGQRHVDLEAVAKLGLEVLRRTCECGRIEKEKQTKTMHEITMRNIAKNTVVFLKKKQRETRDGDWIWFCIWTQKNTIWVVTEKTNTHGAIIQTQSKKHNQHIYLS